MFISSKTTRTEETGMTTLKEWEEEFKAKFKLFPDQKKPKKTIDREAMK